jgi:hypothetical protein
LSCPVLLYIVTVFYHNNTIVQGFNLRYAMNNMQTHYFQFLKQKRISKELLDFVGKIENDSMKNISKFSIEDDAETYSLYTHCSVINNPNSEKLDLHIILPGIDFGLSSHLFTAWDVLLEQALVCKETGQNKDFLIISPLSAIGCTISEKAFVEYNRNGLQFIAELYANWINKFIHNGGKKYNRIILQGMSAGASYALIIGAELEKQGFNNIKLILDNPTLIANTSFIRFLQIPVAFFFEGLYRTILDENVREPIKFEAELKAKLADETGFKITTQNKKLASKFAIKLIELFLLNPSYKTHNIKDCTYNIGKYDFTIQPFINKSIYKNSKVNIIHAGHFINRLKKYLQK